MLDDPLALLPQEVLHERLPVLVRESCAWAVGLSDRPHHVRRHGRAVPSGVTLGALAETGRHLASDEDGRLELGDARAAPVAQDEPPALSDELAGAVFLARSALDAAGLPVPVPPEEAPRLLDALVAEGLETDEVLRVLDELPVRGDTVEEVALLLEAAALRDPR